MSSARLVRSTKSRLFIYVTAVLAFGMVVYMFHSSQHQLDDKIKTLAACNQQTESLSAQLQVIFEYKLRLEKSLSKEKTEHKQTKEECSSKAKQDKDDRERELVEASNKYSALQQSFSLLQSKQKDLEDDSSDLRKKNLKLLEEMEIQKKQLSAKLKEEQQLRLSREKSIENVKNKNLELEVKYNRILDENDELKKGLPESSVVQSLEKAKLQLERELETVKTQLENCRGADKPEEKKVSEGGLGDNQSGLEPPKFAVGYKSGSNSTTPVINPEAVIEHDISSAKPVSKSTKTVFANGGANKGAQEAAVPLKSPENHAEIEMNRQIPMPNNLEPQQSPENTVIKKPEFAAAVREARREEVGPLNPIQEQAAPPIQLPQGQEQLQSAKDKVLNAIRWEDEGQQNGAHEEGEDEAPLQRQGWRGEEGENKVLPRHMNHDYQGMEYDKDNQEEEDEDAEGEQMDYLGDNSRKANKPVAKFHQFEHNAEGRGGGGGGGIMLNPK